MRGQISFNTIIVLVIALMVLLLVGMFFSGGFSDLSDKMRTFGRESTGDSTETGQMVACNNACTGWIAGGCPEEGAAFDTAKEKCGAADLDEVKAKCGEC